MNNLYYLAQSDTLDPGGATTLERHPALCDTGAEVNTAIGCLPFTDSNTLAISTVRIGTGFAGIIALFMISLAAFQIMTSAGDPRRLENGKNLLFSAISGLVFIALSTFVLRLLGVDILGLF